MIKRLATTRWITRSFTTAKEPMTDLGRVLASSIKLNGPLSMSQYMKMCLLHPVHGYYMSKDVFGAQGDFITSPEISQVFGELVAIWYVQQFQLANPSSVQLVELGPGRGTLMYDMLNSLEQFPFIYSRINKVAMVEASPYLRTVQKKKLSRFVDRVHIEWFDRIEDVPKEFSYYTAHEFFDALSVYQFKVYYVDVENAGRV